MPVGLSSSLVPSPRGLRLDRDAKLLVQAKDEAFLVGFVGVEITPRALVSVGHQGRSDDTKGRKTERSEVGG